MLASSFIHLSTHSPTRPFIYSSIVPSIHPSTHHPLTHLSTLPATPQTSTEQVLFYHTDTVPITRGPIRARLLFWKTELSSLCRVSGDSELPASARGEPEGSPM